MGFWNKIFGKKDEQKVGGMEDFMTLIRVYFQAALAADLGITNLAALPDLRVFKSTLKVPTVNNKLGVGERSRCKNMLKSMYQMDVQGDRPEPPSSLQEDTGRTDLSPAVPGLHTGHYDADG